MQRETEPREENRVREGKQRDTVRQIRIVHQKPPFATKMPVVRSETTTRCGAGKLSIFAAEHPGDDGPAPFGTARAGSGAGPGTDVGDGRGAGVDGFLDHATLDLVAYTDNPEGTGDLESPLFFLFGRHLDQGPSETITRVSHALSRSSDPLKIANTVALAQPVYIAAQGSRLGR